MNNIMKDRIKRIRKDKKIKQAEFGERIGVKQSAVTAYETGARMPSNAVIKAICDKYNVNREWLETGEGDPYIVTDKAMIDRIVEQYNGSDVFRAVLETYITLPEDKRRVVEEFVSRLLDYKSKGISKDAYGVDDLSAQTEQAPTDSAQAE